MKLVLFSKQPNAYLTDTHQQWRETPEVITTINHAKYTRFAPKLVNLQGITALYKDEVKSLGDLWLKGATIQINKNSYTNKYPKPEYFYHLVERSYKEMPEDFRKTVELYLNRNRHLEQNVLKEGIKDINFGYNEQRIERMQIYNKNRIKNNYTLLNQFYKRLVADHLGSIFIQSPCEKDFHEVLAEKRFDYAFKNYQSYPKLSEQQLEEFYAYAKYYGVELKPKATAVYHRRTPHGYTEEPVEVPSAKYNTRFENTSGEHIATCNPELIDAHQNKSNNYYSDYSEVITNKDYFTAYQIYKWLKQSDEYLMIGYHRCKECNQIFHENEGCCSTEAITVYSADKTFYGIDGAFEDLKVSSDLLETIDN